MSEENNVSQQNERDQQINLVRHALAEKAFGAYHQLVGTLRRLPLQQNLPLLQKAYLDIDTGMLIIKELIMTGELIFQKPIPLENPDDNQEGIAVGEPYPVQETVESQL